MECNKIGRIFVLRRISLENFVNHKPIVMRKIFLLVAILVAIASPSLLKAQENNNNTRIEGSGNTITKDFAVQSFNELDASGVYSLILIQGDKEAVKVEADDNLMDLFEVKNEGSILKVKMKKNVNISTKKKMKVYVTFRSLKTMDLSMVGNVTTEKEISVDDFLIKNQSVGSVKLRLKARSVRLVNSSVGSVQLEGSADKAVIENTGVGSIKGGDFVVQTMEIENNGVGSSEVNAEKELKVSDSFLGKVKNKGAAPVKKKNKTVI